ncbi:MAG: hypothetical protein LUI39_14470 [Lachnospiraceae bacterium]|nr:hypothetical protein [Lachnospiraceae bacterium]
MSSGTKIIVFRLREIIYTVLLAFFILLLIICLVLMFRQNSNSSAGTMQSDTVQDDIMQSDTTQSDTAQNATVQNDVSEAVVSAGSDKYTPGIYTSSLTLGDSAVDVQVTVSSDSIRSIELVNLSEATEAAYPLVSSSFENIVSQILEKQKLDGITCSAENRYTSQLLLNAISKALKTAQNTNVN